jgi:hypothetical protein
MTDTTEKIQDAATKLNEHMDIEIEPADLTETEAGARLSAAARQRAVASQHTEGLDATTD